MIRLIPVAAVQDVGMKEERVTGIHFDMDELEAFQNLLDPLGVGTGLLA